MTTRNPSNATKSDQGADGGANEARAWAARQLRFEYWLGSLEGRLVSQLDDLANRPAGS